jgi:hypothetical protein
MKKICTRGGTSAPPTAAIRIHATLRPHNGNGPPHGIRLPPPDVHSNGNQQAEAARIPPTADAMSMIGIAICRSLLLWFHLGIGPMIGAGPMQPRHGPPKYLRAPVVGSRHRNTFGLS